MKIKNAVFAVITMIAMVLEGWATETTEAPTTSSSDSTLVPWALKPIEEQVLRSDITNSAFTGSLTEVLIDPDNMESASVLVNDCISNHLQQSHFLSDGSGYVMANGSVTWSNLINDSSTFPGNLALAQLAQIQSIQEQNDISWAMAAVTSWSNDGDLLGDTFSFQGLGLTPTAVMVTTDGNPIMNGGTDQTGEHGILITYMKLFNGNPATVKNWVKTGFVAVHRLEDVSSTATNNLVAQTAVRVSGIATFTPTVSARLTNGAFQVSIPRARAGDSFVLYGTESLSSAWKIYGPISTNTVVIPMDKSVKFFKAVANPNLPVT